MTATEPRRRRPADILVAVIGIVAILWGTYWYVANQLGELALRRAFAAAAAGGVTAACIPGVDSRSPFRLDIGCRSVRISDRAQSLSFDLGGLHVSAPLFPPLSAGVTAAGPASVSDASAKADISWAAAGAEARAGWGGLKTAAIEMKSAELSGDLLSRFDLAGVTLPSASVTIAPLKDADYRLSGSVDALTPKSKAGGSLPPIAASLDLTARNAGNSLGIDPRRALRRWVRNGGAARLDQITIAAGGFSARAEGDLVVSEEGLLSGKVTLRIKGLAALPDLAEAYRPGSREDAERARKILTVVTRDAKAPEGDVRTTSLTLKNGVVSFGLLPLVVLPPVF